MDKIIKATVEKFYIAESDEESMKHFGMPIPDTIELRLSEALVKKLQKMQELIAENMLTSIKTLSSYRNHPDTSYAVFYKNGKQMEISRYIDVDRYYDTVDVHCFELKCDAFHKNMVQARFIFTSASCREILITTKPFSIEE